MEKFPLEQPQAHQSDAAALHTPPRPVPYSLSQSAAEGVVWFTPALLAVKGYFDRDVVSEFLKTAVMADPDDLPFHLSPEKYRLFSALRSRSLWRGRIDWDRRLYGVSREGWEPLRDFITSIEWFDPKKGTGGRVGLHSLNIVDPYLLESAPARETPPFVEVQVFCVRAGDAIHYLSPATNPPHNRPQPAVYLAQGGV